MSLTKSFNKTALTLLSVAVLTACQPSSDKTASASKEATHTQKPATAVEQKTTQASLLRAADLPNYLERSIQDEVFYFVLPDRFHNGDTSNDNGSKTIAASRGGFDPSSKGMYHGGDIPGLKEKLPYLNEMGISAIWLTPIMRNQAMQGDDSGYHGYWILDFTEIDPHLGSNQDLKDFIAEAHKYNIKIFFDIITNHSADVIKYEECHEQDGTPENDCAYKSLAQKAAGDVYTPFLPKGTENLKVPAWLNDPKYYHNQGETNWQGENSIYGDFAGLDDIDTDNPEVVKGMTDIFKGVISEFKPDGFRIDTVKHVNMEFWQEFAPALVDHAKAEGIPQFFMFGEVYSGDPEFLSTFTTTGKMQSVLDFAFQFTTAKALVDGEGTDVYAELFAQDHNYNDADSNSDQLLSFVSNHDMGRLAYMLDAHENNYSEAEKVKRVDLAHAIMYFSRGIPVVYYGDEQGFVGDGNDKDSRQNMMPSKVASYNDDVLLATDKTTADDNFDQSHLFYQTFAKYADLYYRYPALRYGKQEVVFTENTPGLLALTRTGENGEKLLLVANTSTENINKAVELTAEQASLVFSSEESAQATVKNNELDISLAPLSFALYKL